MIPVATVHLRVIKRRPAFPYLPYLHIPLALRYTVIILEYMLARLALTANEASEIRNLELAIRCKSLEFLGHVNIYSGIITVV